MGSESTAPWDKAEDYLQEKHKNNELQGISRGTRGHKKNQ